MKKMKSRFSVWIIIFAALALSACSETQYAAHLAKSATGGAHYDQVGSYKVGNPYRIAGRLYHPRESYRHVETGVASWYGPNFHGKKTANGEIFNKFDLTAAHRTLQMPSIIRVTNLDNGRNVILRVNDRGPFSKERVLDVSERGAEVLGFKANGTARVRVEVLERESRQVAALAKQGKSTRHIEVALNKGQTPVHFKTPQAAPVQVAHAPTPQVKPGSNPIPAVRVASVSPSPLPEVNPIQEALGTQNMYVQAGSFSQEQNAMALSQKLSSIGPSNVSFARVNGRPFYRVRIGPFAEAYQADQALNAVLANGHDTAKIVTD